MDTKRKILTNISSKSWEHPTDKAALTALENVPGLDLLVKKFVGLTTEKSIRLATLVSAVRVSDKQFPRLNTLFEEACHILDLPKRPELFVSQNPFLNAGATGVDNPFIVLNTSVMDTMSDEEILGILGHELGHCMSGHVLYKTLLYYLVRASSFVLNIPLSGIAVIPIIIALYEWDRKSELSADRAGLLVSQNPEGYYSSLMKMAGGSDYSKMDLNEFFLQAQEYENMDGLGDDIHKFLNILMLSHPFPVLRLTELKTWVDCGEYDRILSNQYVLRGAEDDHVENLKAAKDQYQKDFKSSKGPIGGATSSVIDAVDSIADHAKDLKDKASGVWDSLFEEQTSKTR